MKIPKIPNRLRGFALVVTLSLMILLTVVAVGLLSLATISLRASSQSEAMATAKSNARMALMLALGDLQKQAGTDRAITAPASIVDKKYTSGVSGVWSPWEETDGQTADSRSDSAREAKFRQWLVSTVDGKIPDQPNTPPISKIGDAGTVAMLGEGSLTALTSTTGGDHRFSLRPTKVVKGKNVSGMAWAVMEENTKARADLYKDPTTENLSWTKVTRASAPPIEGVKTMPNWDKFVVGEADKGKLVSLSSLSLNSTVDAKDVSFCSPDATVYSNSLLTDPVSGGFKADMSMWISRGLGTDAKAKLYNKSKVITDLVSSDPYISLLANYHQLYKKLGVRDGAVRPSAWQVVARLPTGHNPYTGNPAVDTSIGINRAAPTEPLLVPSVLRVDMIFSMIARNAHGGWGARFTPRPYLLHMQYLPVVTLHNPYSVPIVFEGMRVTFKNLPVGFNFRVDNGLLSSDLVALNQMFVNRENSDAINKEFGITLKAAFGSTSPMVLQPGQTKLFGTPRVSPNYTWAQDRVGDGAEIFDWRSDKTADFSMAPTMVTSPTIGMGFDIDWLNPVPKQSSVGGVVGTDKNGGKTGMVSLMGTEKLGLQFGPYAPPAGGGAFTVAIDLLKNIAGTPPTVVKAGGFEVRYGTQERLKQILESGKSERFNEPRSFPESFPKANVDPDITVGSILEADGAMLKDYVKPRPFMIFSVAAKTTKESFLPAKTMLAGNTTGNIAIVDLTKGKDPEGGVPLELVMMPIRQGKAAIEEKREEIVGGTKVRLEEGFFFGGNGNLNGTPRATLYEFPVAPLQSLAQFRHANLASSGFMPFTTYTVGESYAHPQIGANAVRQKWTDGSDMLDHTFLSNEALWDHYFLSTVADQGGPLFGTATKTYNKVLTDFFEKDTKLLNPRFAAYNNGSKVTPTTLADTGVASPAYQRLGAYLMLEGGFNVNSTSVNAWKAVYAALDEASIDTVAGVDPGATERYSMPRVRRPSETNIDADILPQRQKRWQGYRRLNKSQIEELAKNTVDEIRTRGPFLSLSDFVNRRVGSDGPLTLKGAIQAALDNTAINAAMKVDGKELGAADVTQNGYKSVDAGIGNSAEFAPGFVTQGDILSAIGSRIAVRSDTFRIRAYGEAKDATGNVVLAKAWCEAVVQRVPDFVDPGDAPYTAFSSINAANKKFGRRLQIVSFRWLGSKEV